MLESDGANVAKCPHSPTCGVRSNHPLPPARGSDSFGPACRQAGWTISSFF
jgi:hypothetical protein